MQMQVASPLVRVFEDLVNLSFPGTQKETLLQMVVSFINISFPHPTVTSTLFSEPLLCLLCLNKILMPKSPLRWHTLASHSYILGWRILAS